VTLAATLHAYVERQIAQIVPGFSGPIVLPRLMVEVALERVERNVVRQIGGERGFNPLVSGQYATFLYYLAHELRDDQEKATHLFLLNKALNGIDLYYDVIMPDYFLIGHTVGMVFAKATYGDFCVFHQGCTVGRILADRPILGNGVIIYPGGAIIGRCRVEENTVVSAGVKIINTNTPGNCIVFSGPDGRPVFKPLTENYSARYYQL
jgi:serine O-acetyltransferase